MTSPVLLPKVRSEALLASARGMPCALRLPLVWRARADTFPNTQSWPPGREERLVAFLNRRVHGIAATTHYEAEMMVRAGVDPSRVRVIHNGVDLHA